MAHRISNPLAALPMLPSELLLCISDLIPPASAVALKLTSRRFFDLTPIKFKPRELDECAIKAISWSLD
ncbi:hypothetical protein LTR60_006383, partial [Cryomyces antarcticus]